MGEQTTKPSSQQIPNTNKELPNYQDLSYLLIFWSTQKNVNIEQELSGGGTLNDHRDEKGSFWIIIDSIWRRHKSF